MDIFSHECELCHRYPANISNIAFSTEIAGYGALIISSFNIHNLFRLDSLHILVNIFGLKGLVLETYDMAILEILCG